MLSAGGASEYQHFLPLTKPFVRLWRSQTLTDRNVLDDKLNLVVAGLLLATTIIFCFWGLGTIDREQTTLFLVAAGFGLFMAFSIGANDVANSFGTSVGAGTLTMRQALVIAAVFEVSGAVLAGGAVTETIRKGIVDLGPLSVSTGVDPLDFVHIMLSALLSAALWLTLATSRGWPISTTHSIIGGIVGSSLTLGALSLSLTDASSLINWDQIVLIGASWILSPLLGGSASFIVYGQIKRHVLTYNSKVRARLEDIDRSRAEEMKAHQTRFAEQPLEVRTLTTAAIARDAALASTLTDDTPRPALFESRLFKNLQKLKADEEDIESHKALTVMVPIIAAAGSSILTAMLLFKGLKNTDVSFSTFDGLLVVSMVSALVWVATMILARSMRTIALDRATFVLFSWMQVFTAAGFAFSHGSNDIANAIGPFAAILDVLQSGEIASETVVPPAAMISFGVAMVGGLWFLGRDVIYTVGTQLTKMHPASGFSAELSAASVVLVASTFGLPVSSTHILVGAILGIGIVNRSTNWQLMKPIALAWIVTLPMTTLLSAVIFVLLPLAL